MTGIYHGMVSLLDEIHREYPILATKVIADGGIRDATVDAGLGEAIAVHRGCAIADFDADGRSDIVVLVLGGQPELWHNEGDKVFQAGARRRYDGPSP